MDVLFYTSLCQDEEEAALKVIGATEAKVDTLEDQVLGRIDNGTAGVMEVEAVLEFLAQVTEK